MYPLTEKNAIELPLFLQFISGHWNPIAFPVTKMSHKMALYIVYQEKPLNFQFPVKTQWKLSENPLKHHWKWIIMQISLHQLNDVIFQC